MNAKNKTQGMQIIFLETFFVGMKKDLFVVLQPIKKLVKKTIKTVELRKQRWIVIITECLLMKCICRAVIVDLLTSREIFFFVK